MKYKISSGVVHETICGEELLIASGEARKKVPMVRWLNESGAYLWKLLEKGETGEKIIMHVVNDYEIDRDEALAIIQSFFNELCKAGYLVPVEDTDEEGRTAD